jgi:hypothetical protein
MQKYQQMSGLANIGVGAAGQLSGNAMNKEGLNTSLQQTQMNNQNQMAMNQANIAAQQKMNQQNANAGFWSGVLQLGGTALGAILAGPPGAAAGNVLGNMFSPRPKQQYNYNQNQQQPYYG